MNSEPEVVVVTGASAGVGRATVREFAREGARIGLLARGRDRLEATRAEVEAAGGRALPLPTDVADAAQVEAAAAAVEQELGPIDVWVNCAMTTVFSPFLEITTEEFKRVTEVTYLGYVYGTQAALRRMVPRNRGVVVQVGSALAYRAIPLQSAYCGAKHAIRGFTDQHAAVRLVQDAHAPPAAARPADLRARGCRARHRLGRSPPVPRSLRRRLDRLDHPRQ
jgi:NAD(P)-dependent dehydrogenase (short-subunit alcohol dehydrogenase family)